MPRGPKGEKRPANAIGNAVMIAKIAHERDRGPPEDGKNAAAHSSDSRGPHRPELCLRMSRERTPAETATDAACVGTSDWRGWEVCQPRFLHSGTDP
jgi:hypothetical protein